MNDEEGLVAVNRRENESKRGRGVHAAGSVAPIPAESHGPPWDVGPLDRCVPM